MTDDSRDYSCFDENVAVALHAVHCRGRIGRTPCYDEVDNRVADFTACHQSANAGHSTGTQTPTTKEYEAMQQIGNIISPRD